VLSDSPSAYYHLDDTGTTAIDASGHGRNGTIGSSVTENIPGLIASSTDTADTFAGLASAAGVISVPANAALQPTTSVSIEAWLRFTSMPATFTFVTGYGSDSYYAPYGLFFRAAGQIVAQFFLTGGVLEVPSSVNLAPNTTYHVVGTFDGTTGRIYVNGAQVGSATKTGTIGDYIAGYGFSMGDDAARSDPAYKGTLDEVAVYAGKALSATQVQNHYTAGTVGGSTPPSPTPTPAGGSADWPTMGYDIARTGYNASETTIGTSNVAGLHSVWSRSIGGQIGEPVYASSVSVNGVATNVLYAASASGKALALNADTGAQIWSQPIGTSSYTCPNGGGTFTFGPTGTPALDLARGRVYIPDGAAEVHAYDLSTGAEVSGWPVTIASPANFNFIEAGLTFNSANGMLYAETSSTCDISPWNGRITAINTSTAAIVNTFFPTQGTSGGGIWGLGGASIDRTTNDVYIATGNADTSNGGSQSAFYAEQIVALSPDLATVIGHSYATLPPSSDADYGATPLLFQPPGCGPLLAAVNKSGLFVLFDRTNISAGPTQTIQMSIPTDNGDFIGVPAYDPATNHVYVGLPATEGIYKPGLGAFQMSANCTLNPTPVWNAVFGADGAVLTTDDTPRSPIAIANGVVYVDDYDNSVAYAFSAASGAQLWTTALSGKGIVGPIVVNGHLYTSDITGKITDWIP
jgi:outer membrane protein assembly factor BamB